MKNYIVFFSLLSIEVLVANSLRAQNIDTAGQKKQFKNTIRFNISAPLIFGGRYLVLGYERILAPGRSFSINLGTFGLPDFISDSDSLKISGAQKKNSGFHVSADYRFYLAKENRYAAPHGVYIGPYYSFNHLSRETTWEFNSNSFSGNVGTTLNVNIHTAGVELGYQFIFWKRMAVDFVAVGPGIAYYNFKTGINANLKPEKRNELLEAIIHRVTTDLPGAGKFLDNAQYKDNSGISTWNIGYRYIVHIGYRF